MFLLVVGPHKALQKPLLIPISECHYGWVVVTRRPVATAAIRPILNADISPIIP